MDHGCRRKADVDREDRGVAPDARERVEGYVDALLEKAGRGDGQGRVGEEGSEEEREGDVEHLDLSFRGALSHLADEYTAEELLEEANEWRMKKALDY